MWFLLFIAAVLFVLFVIVNVVLVVGHIEVFAGCSHLVSSLIKINICPAFIRNPCMRSQASLQRQSKASVASPACIGGFHVPPDLKLDVLCL